MTRQEMDHAIAVAYGEAFAAHTAPTPWEGKSTVAERIAFVAGIRAAARQFYGLSWGPYMPPQVALIELADQLAREI